MNTIIRNFITTLKRFKLASTLNVIGLSLAFTAFLVIIMQVRYEYAFDTSYPDSYRIGRLNKHMLEQDIMFTPRALMEHCSEVAAIEQLTIAEPAWGNSYITVERQGERIGFNEPIGLVYKNFPSFFGLQLADGSFDGFDAQNKVIIPASVAEKFFGKKNVSGQALRFYNDPKNDFVIAAVYNDLPTNSQIKNHIYCLFSESKGLGIWGQSNYQIYAKLKDISTFDQASQQINLLDASVRQYCDSISITPIENAYFDPNHYYGQEQVAIKGNRDTTNILLAIAILIIAIAAINFVNFSTSLAPMRMKSINTQKILGSTTGILRWALIGEAVGISIIAFGLSMIWIYCLERSPWQDITLSGIAFTGNEILIYATGAIALIVGLLAGVYPAFYTTKFPPAIMTRGNFAMSKAGRRLRMALVGFQYVVSIGLIIGAIFLQLQNSYMRNVDKGFASEQVVVVSLGGQLMNRQTFENRLKENANIADIAYCQYRLGLDNQEQGWGKEFKQGEEMKNFGALMCTWNFPQVMGLKVLDGELMTESMQKSENIYFYYLFNQTAQDNFNFKIGDRLDTDQNGSSVIHAVINDFSFMTMRNGIEPTALVVATDYAAKKMSWCNPAYFSFAYIRTQGDAMTTFNHIKSTVASIDPTFPSVVSFYDESFEQMYSKEIKTSSLITFFSLLAILISLVGVFGLVVFETQYKRKEIGLRKVMGSTVNQILIMFNKKFVLIVAVCFIIAVPLAYLGVDTWLGGFAYRTPMVWWAFAAGGLIVFFITILTVTIQSYRAATENPVKSLEN